MIQEKVKDNINKEETKAQAPDAQKMTEIVTRRRFIRSTPDKVRKAASLVNKKKVIEALNILQFAPMSAARSVALTLKQGLAIAKENDFDENNLVIKGMRIDEGPKLKRRRIVHQGRATAILKRMAHLTIVLEVKAPAVKNKKKLVNSVVKQKVKE